MNQQCRFCCNSEAIEMYSLSDALNDGKSIAQTIEDCFRVSISDDELSSLCCVHCSQDLIVAMKLLTRIYESGVRFISLELLTKENSKCIEDKERLPPIVIAEENIKLESEEPTTELKCITEFSPAKTIVKRGRGRPKQVKVEENSPAESQSPDEASNTLPNPAKKQKQDENADFSAESEDDDFEPDGGHEDSSSEEPPGTSRSFYGVKSNSKPRRCCSCKDFTLDSMEKVKDHSKKYHFRPVDSKEEISKAFECLVCFARFETKKQFRQHERKMYVKELHSCKHCDEQFANPYVLQTHLKNDHQRRLKVHQMEDKCMQSNICCGCRKQFESQEQLKEHSLQVHLPQREPPQIETAVECDTCYKSFKSARYLKDHKLRFWKEKKFVCSQCGRGFCKPSQLEDHEDAHRNVRKYECPVCHEKFSMKAYWLVHVRNHNSEESFHCEYCGKGFRQKSLLKGHMRVHSEDRPHKCPMCPLSFTLKNRFDAHVLEHAGMKAFKCQQCSASYIHQRALRRHVREKHEGDFTYSCTICPKGFVELKPLLVHLKTHEKNSEASNV
ncbi:hypothetical protein pipiens_013110 [Culex pipiens pipiens]|uniref:Zinc finger protein n=1 Tax=Culex pipiens pipiens TaxID=38569 RepID=A0ABD1CZN4_CULPP